MTARFVHQGNNLDIVPATDIDSGSVIISGDLIGIASLPIPADALGSITVTGVFDIRRETGAATPLGTKLYFDAANNRVSDDDDSGARPYIGMSVQAAADNDPTVRLRLNH